MQCQQDPGLRRPQVVEGRLAALAEALAAAATEKGAHQAAPSPIAPVAHDIALAELAMTAASAIRAGDRREAGCGSAFAHSLLLPGVSGRKHSAAAAKRQYIKGSTPALPTTTKYGGRGLGASDAGPAEQKLDREPWLKRIFAGYAFALDYRDRRGHAYALFDQEQTRRVTERQQPGACLQCHASVVPLYRFVGKGDVRKGFEAVSGMLYQQAHDLVDQTGRKLVEHSVACLDCHDPKTMAPRVTRPAFIAGIQAVKARAGIPDYDPNRDARRQEMRAFVCGQCHVEYYFKGPGKVVTYPWASGLRVEEIEQYYHAENFSDWVHAETGDKVLKAQHPEFEVWSQGVHARAGVACADCHMPYERVGAAKVSDHWVRSPLLNVNRACQPCHAVPEEELRARVLTIQDRHYALLERAATATTDMLDAIVAAKKAGATAAGLDRGGAAPEGAMAARLRGRRELDGLPRPAGARAHPGRGDRLRAPGAARRRDGVAEVGGQR